MKILKEADLINKVLSTFTPEQNPKLVQIGANEGMYEYAKKDEKDFIFEFLLHNPYWEAVLVEPIPNIFKKIKVQL